MKLFNTIAYHSTKQMGMKEFNDVTDSRFAFKGEGAMIHGWGLYLQADKKKNERDYLSRFAEYTYENDYDYDKYSDYDFIYRVVINGKTLIGVNTDYETNCDYIEDFTFDELDYYDETGNLVYPRYDIDGESLSILREFGYDKNKLYEIFDKNIQALRNREDLPTTEHFKSEQDWEKAIKWCEDIKESVKNIPYDFQYETIRHSGDWQSDVGIKKKISGAQYTVEIPDDWVFLVEDELISNIINDNNRAVFESLAKSLWKVSDRTSITFDEFKNTLFDIDGENFYKNIIAKMFNDSEQKASWWLAEHYIKGIQYNGGRDDLCYVIFDCEELKIIKEE